MVKISYKFLADQKFSHKFRDCVNPICSCGQEIKTSTHFIFHYPNYSCARQTLCKKPNEVDSAILKQNDRVLRKL